MLLTLLSIALVLSMALLLSIVTSRGAYRASRARIALGSARARLKFPRLGSARELAELELGS